MKNAAGQPLEACPCCLYPAHGTNLVEAKRRWGALKGRIFALEAAEAEMRTLAAKHSESADKAHARIAALEAENGNLRALAQSLAEQESARISELEAENAVLRVALETCDHDCEHLIHEDHERHEDGEPCPVEARIERALHGRGG